MVAHRGDASHAPENTFAAARAGFGVGADMVEIDVRLAADRVPVVIHDANLMRVAGRPERVGELTSSQLASVDVGSWFGAQFAGEGVPTLQDLLRLASPARRLLIEVKELDAARPTAIAIRRAGAENAVAVQSFIGDVIKQMRPLLPSVPMGLLYGSCPGLGETAARKARNLARLAWVHGASFVALADGCVDGPLLQEMSRVWPDLLVWTVDDVDRMLELTSGGVGGIITNRPGACIDALRRAA